MIRLQHGSAINNSASRKSPLRTFGQPMRPQSAAKTSQLGVNWSATSEPGVGNGGILINMGVLMVISGVRLPFLLRQPQATQLTSPCRPNTHSPALTATIRSKSKRVKPASKLLVEAAEKRRMRRGWDSSRACHRSKRNSRVSNANDAAVVCSLPACCCLCSPASLAVRYFGMPTT